MKRLHQVQFCIWWRPLLSKRHTTAIFTRMCMLIITKASRHFTVPETACLLKKVFGIYIIGARTVWRFHNNKSPPKNAWPSPFALWIVRWKTVALRATVGVVNTAILLAVAEWIVAAADHSLLRQDCGSLVLTKHAWAKANSVEKNGICEAPSLKAKGAVSFGHSCWRHNKWHHSVSRNQLGSDRHSP